MTSGIPNDDLADADAPKKKLPWLKFYPTDWLGDPKLRRCEPPARALWIDCICLMHEGDPYGHLAIKGRAMTPAEIGQGTGQSWRTVEKLLAQLEAADVCSRSPQGLLYSRRMVRDEQTRQRRAAGGVKSLTNPNVPRPKHASETPSKDISKDILPDVLSTSSGVSERISIKDPPRYQRLEARDQSTTTTTTTTSQPAVAGDSLNAWIAPIAEAWEATMGPASFQWGRAAKALKPLYGKVESSTVARRLGHYLAAADDPKYVTIERFATTHGCYENKPKKKTMTFTEWLDGDPMVDSTGVCTEKGDLATNPGRVLEWERYKKAHGIVESVV